MFFWAWLISLFVRKSVEVAGEAPHIEPEESDWNWDDNKDAQQEVRNLGLILKLEEAKGFFVRVALLIEKGFGGNQIEVVSNLVSKLHPEQERLLEYNLRAFNQGMSMQILIKGIDHKVALVRLVAEPVLAFELSQIIDEFDQSQSETKPESPDDKTIGLN